MVSMAILLLQLPTVYGQSKKALKSYTKAQDELRNENVEAALVQLDKAIDESPDYVDALLFKADLLMEMGRVSEAPPVYESAIKAGAPYYVYLFYGRSLFENKRYEEAIAALERYKEDPKASKKYVIQADRMIEDSQFAIQATANPVDYKPKNLGPMVNTKAMEYFPSISADGRTLVFTYRDPFGEQQDEDFRFTTRESIDAPWTKARAVKGMLNTTLNEGAQSLAASGNVIFFAACNRPDGKGSCDIYASFLREDGSYSKPRNLGGNINTIDWESQPSISSDGRTLYFARGKGSTSRNIDIYTSTLSAEGYWSVAKRLEGEVNTPEQESTPFIHFDNQSLYFSSNGHPGMGMLDFFVSRKQEDGTWGKPQNLGYPLNTSGDEFSMIVAPDGKTGYFASDNFEGGFGDLDLYSFEVPIESRAQEIAYVMGKVSNASTGEPLTADIVFSNLDNEKAVLTEKTTGNGDYFSVLPANADYGLSIQKKGYLFYSKNFSLTNQSAEKAYELNVKLIPIEVGLSVKLENIFFDFDSYTLQERSFAEMASIKGFLEENPSVKISIEGHTDNEGTSAYNKALSENRAKSVYTYLVEAGIDKSRISYKGYGDTKPLAANDTEEGRALNRRTEIKITSVGN